MKRCNCCKHFDWDTDGGYCYLHRCLVDCDDICIDNDDEAGDDTMIPMSVVKDVLETLERNWVIDTVAKMEIVNEINNRLKP